MTGNAGYMIDSVHSEPTKRIAGALPFVAPSSFRFTVNDGRLRRDRASAPPLRIYQDPAKDPCCDQYMNMSTCPAPFLIPHAAPACAMIRENVAKIALCNHDGRR